MVGGGVSGWVGGVSTERIAGSKRQWLPTYLHNGAQGSEGRGYRKLSVDNLAELPREPVTLGAQPLLELDERVHHAICRDCGRIVHLHVRRGRCDDVRRVALDDGTGCGAGGRGKNQQPGALQKPRSANQLADAMGARATYY